MQDNWGVIGHQKIVEFFNKSLAANRLAQTYLFYGQESLGKTTLADKLASIILKTPEAKLTDLYKIEALDGKKNIAIEQIREWRKKLALKAFSSGYKVGIIYEAEKLNLESANALLKIIEEPTEKTVIILISSSWDKLLPTIVSRSQLIRFSKVAHTTLAEGLAERQYQPLAVEEIISWVGGFPGKAIGFLEKPELFADYKKMRQQVAGVFNLNLADRFLAVDKLLAPAKEFNEKIVLALEFIRHFQTVLRYLLLYQLQQGVFGAKPAVEIKKQYTLESLFKIGLLTKESQQQLLSNVQPKLVLENLLINL